MADRGWSTADSTAAYAAGAATSINAQRLAQQRQEQLMRMKAEEAERAIDERYKAAQADLLTQNAAMLQKDREIEEALPMTWQQQLEATGWDHEAAIRNTLEIAAMASPRVAAKLAGTIKTMAEAQNVGKPTAHQQQLERLAQERLDVSRKAEARRSDQEKRLVGREARLGAKVPPLSKVQQKEVDSIYKRIDAMQKEHDEIVPEEGSVKKHPNTIKRMKLNTEITRLKARARSIAGARELPKVPEGRVLVIKDGQMGHIPLSQLEDALAEGFEQVEEGEAMQQEGDAMMQEGEE